MSTSQGAIRIFKPKTCRHISSLRIYGRLEEGDIIIFSHRAVSAEDMF